MSMKISEKKFNDRVGDGIQDSFMRGAVSSAQTRLYTNRLKAADELGNWEEWRELGEQIRQHTLENLDYYLMQLSENVSKEADTCTLRRRKRKLQSIFKTLPKRNKRKSSKIKVDGNRRN